MPKRFIGIDVFTAAKERIAWTFDRFSRVYIAFSGGKDSTVMLHLVMDEAIRRDRKAGICFVDLEGQYEITIKHIENCFKLYEKNIDAFWCALPIHLRNAVSVYETHWICWEPGKEDIWVRYPPEIAITDREHFPFFRDGMEFEEFVPEFGEWYSDGEPCACFVGIRADESLNRFRTIANTKKIMLEEKQWTTLVKQKRKKKTTFIIFTLFTIGKRKMFGYIMENTEINPTINFMIICIGLD